MKIYKDKIGGAIAVKSHEKDYMIPREIPSLASKPAIKNIVKTEESQIKKKLYPESIRIKESSLLNAIYIDLRSKSITSDNHELSALMKDLNEISSKDIYNRFSVKKVLLEDFFTKKATNYIFVEDQDTNKTSMLYDEEDNINNKLVETYASILNKVTKANNIIFSN